MRFGFRKPSFSKSFKAKTTGRLKRSIKRVINPWYGHKGMGVIHSPKRSIYNEIYHRMYLHTLLLDQLEVIVNPASLNLRVIIMSLLNILMKLRKTYAVT